MVAAWAYVAAAAIAAASSLQASSQASDSIRRGQTLEKEHRRELLGIQRQQIQGGEPFRALAGESAALLREDILRTPGTGATFERALEQGSENLAGQLSKFGVLRSTGGGKAFGELAGNLTAADLASIRSQRLELLNLGQAGFGNVSNIASVSGASTGRSSALSARGGDIQAGATSSIGNLLAQLTLLGGQDRSNTTTTPAQQPRGNVLNPTGGGGSLGGMLQTNFGN